LVILTVLLIALPAAFVLRSVLGGWTTLISVRALEEADVAYVEDLGVFVVNTDGRPVALSEVSPHLGHPLVFCRAADVFQGKHGEVFDRRGFHSGGPSARGMDRVAIRVRDDLVEIDPEDVRLGPPRGGGPPLEPTGELCEVPGPVNPPGFAAEPAL
jgi:nitrite reductase/ring-hydroxylating ferredoxin subunit